jgi:hypothetical protein
MDATPVGTEIRDPNQKFIYVYDFVKNWSFLVELISVSKEEGGKMDLPVVIKSEGIAPSQYGTKGLVGDKLTEIEEKYDLTKGTEGFVVVGEADSEEKEEGEAEGEEEGEGEGEEEGTASEEEQ